MSLLFRPESLSELHELLSRQNCEKHFLAGGTDWIIKNRGKISSNSVVIDISKIGDFCGIEIVGSVLRVGSMETMSRIHSNQAIQKYAAALADAASAMGSVQIRNMATIGGNVANASFAADTPCALASLCASAVVASRYGEHRLAVEEMSDGANNNKLADGEYIKYFEIPLREGYVSAFKKIGSRTAVSIARLNMAISARWDGDVFADARVYVGTLGHPARRCGAAELSLCSPDSSRCEVFKKALENLTEEMIPGRSTLPYKKAAIKALGEDTLALLAMRAGGGLL